MSRLSRFSLLLPALFVLNALPATALDATEARIVDWVDAHNDEALALVEETVNINSGTLNFDGVRRVGDVLSGHFRAAGLDTEWIDGAPFERAGHLVARWRGGAAAPRRHLLLIGHLDTVFEPDSPFQRFERISETEARGPGTTDMKGGNVVMLHALRALRSVGALDALDVTVVLTGDEERSGRPLSAAREALVEAARAADVAIGFEDGDGNPKTAVIARRGSGSWQLRVTGKPAHSSQVFQPEVGAGAIYEAARALSGFREALADEEDLTFNAGVVLGGTDVDFDAGQARGSAFGKNNVIAEHALVTGDIRAMSPEQYERATRAMFGVAAANLPHTSAELTFSESYPPMAPSEGNRRLLRLYDAVSRDLGFGPVEAVNPRNAGAADVSFAAGLVEMALDGIGLMGRGGHTVDEVADLTTLSMQTQRAAVLMLRLARAAVE